MVEYCDFFVEGSFEYWSLEPISCGDDDLRIYSAFQ